MTTTARHPLPAPRPDLAAYATLDLRRMLRNKATMFFAVALPAFMYVVFGLGSDDSYGSGDVAFYVMVSLACYGAATATTSVAGSAALEQQLGWGRQLALTPLRPIGLVMTKAAAAMLTAAVAAGLIYLVGGTTGATGSAGDWVVSALVVWLGSAMFALYGLAISLHFRGDNAVSIASGLIVVLAFLGNVFTPLSGVILDIGRFTPLYGYAALARYPQTQGWTPSDTHDEWWLMLANVIVWTLCFAALALVGVRRGRERV